MNVSFHIPAPSSMLVSNLLGVLGLVLVVVAVGGLAGVWWALLTAGVFLVGLSVITATHSASEGAAERKPATVASVPRSA